MEVTFDRGKARTRRGKEVLSGGRGGRKKKGGKGREKEEEEKKGEKASSLDNCGREEERRRRKGEGERRGIRMPRREADSKTAFLGNA